jgi:hypothetical protein
VGVGPVRSAAVCELIEDEIELFCPLTADSNKLVVCTVDNSPQTLFDLAWSICRSLEQCHRTTKSRRNRIKQIGDNRTPRSSLQNRKTLDNFMRRRL